MSADTLSEREIAGEADKEDILGRSGMIYRANRGIRVLIQPDVGKMKKTSDSS
jgi:hypothetical protein